uniref:Uncharacterized protein n=1 Tax=uncultured marine virus TaxID=186617 RepID=A0A0F7L795_9VIRU|nr:hypothetical protein [uncultured marine virus]
MACGPLMGACSFDTSGTPSFGVGATSGVVTSGLPPGIVSSGSKSSTRARTSSTFLIPFFVA